MPKCRDPKRPADLARKVSEYSRGDCVALEHEFGAEFSRNSLRTWFSLVHLLTAIVSSPSFGCLLDGGSEDLLRKGGEIAENRALTLVSAGSGGPWPMWLMLINVQTGGFDYKSGGCEFNTPKLVWSSLSSKKDLKTHPMIPSKNLLATGKYGCRKVRVYPAECGEQLGRDPSKNGSSKSLVLKSSSGEGTLGFVPSSHPHSLGYACTLYAPLPLSQTWLKNSHRASTRAPGLKCC